MADRDRGYRLYRFQPRQRHEYMCLRVVPRETR